MPCSGKRGGKCLAVKVNAAAIMPAKVGANVVANEKSNLAVNAESNVAVNAYGGERCGKPT